MLASTTLKGGWSKTALQNAGDSSTIRIGVTESVMMNYPSLCAQHGGGAYLQESQQRGELLVQLDADGGNRRVIETGEHGTGLIDDDVRASVVSLVEQRSQWRIE